LYLAVNISYIQSLKKIYVITRTHRQIRVTKKDEMGRRCSTQGEKRNAYRVLVGKPEGNRPLERPRRRWENNIEMDCREIRLGGMDWIQLAQDRDRWRALVNTVINILVP
jgi:hypothetical protein